MLDQRVPGGPPPHEASPDYDRSASAGGAVLRTAGRGCCSRAGLVCRSALWGAINALYFERTGDGQAREDAFRSLNYATYFAQSDGKISASGNDFNQYWYEDGYADAGRGFIWAIGAVPEFAPIGQDHLLRSTSVVQHVTYGDGRIQYRTFDDSATEVLRLTFRPGSIVAGNRPLSLHPTLESDSYTIGTLGGGDYEVHVRHAHSGQVEIRR